MNLDRTIKNMPTMTQTNNIVTQEDIQRLIDEKDLNE